MPDYTPTPSNLRAVAAFLRARSLDEASASGSMKFYRERGVTLGVQIPNDAVATGSAPEHCAAVNAWLDEHSPDRFVKLAHELADMAGTIADLVAGTPASERGYNAHHAWRTVTRAARLWETHPDFDLAWAEEE
ncbi:hypothetical protein [Streptomyces sp. NPDC018584]|uniref:hypothetical protein n=1 Tax=unclassified Streptomyces TaxID=2593676 RepID=UPI00379B87AE